MVTLKTLLEASTADHPIEAKLFEAETEIGGTFKYRSYENAELVSSKQLTTFSDFRLPQSTPDHISLPEYVEYLRSYADAFNLWPHINLGHRVTMIEPVDKSQAGTKWKHRVTHSSIEAPDEEAFFDCSHVAICTGLHVQPNEPSIPGIENVKGEVFHSVKYKERAQLVGRDILILGCGETAMGNYAAGTCRKSQY